MLSKATTTQLVRVTSTTMPSKASPTTLVVGATCPRCCRLNEERSRKIRRNRFTVTFAFEEESQAFFYNHLRIKAVAAKNKISWHPRSRPCQEAPLLLLVATVEEENKVLLRSTFVSGDNEGWSITTADKEKKEERQSDVAVEKMLPFLMLNFH